MIAADGVGQAYISELLAREVTIAIAENPSTDLKRNLTAAVDSATHLVLPEPNTGTALIDEALKKTREEEGSESMLNQLSIDSNTGKVDGLFLGDGGFSVLRVNGQKEHYLVPDQVESLKLSNLRLSSKRGVRGQPMTLRDVVDKNIVLNLGDSVLLYSDSLQHKIGGVMLIDKVCEILTSEKEPDAALARFFEEIARQDPNDDDKTLLRYTHLQ